MRGVPDRFGDFKTEAAIRTPGQVLAHIGDLLDWSLSLADGRHVWNDSGSGAVAGGGGPLLPGLARLDDASPWRPPSG